MVDSLERIRLTTRVSQQEWLDLLGVHWDEYQSFKSGHSAIEERAIEAVARRFNFPSHAFINDEIDYRALALSVEAKERVPERYLRAAHGRRRATMNSVDYLERIGGWRLRLDVIEKFEFPEIELQDAFAPISVLFMTDLCSYLHRRQFRSSVLFSMGAYTFEATKKTIVGQLFSAMSSVKELYEHFFSDCMRLFEANCDYRLTKIDAEGGVLEISSNSHVAGDLGVVHIGNKHLCQFKAGMIACIPMYLGRPMARVEETSCVHRGDTVCRFEFSFSEVGTVTPP